MKKYIAILLVLVLAGVGLFATPGTLSEGPSTIKLQSVVGKFSAFGVSSTSLLPADFASLATFVGKMKSSIIASVTMLDLNAATPVGFVAGVNNASAPVNLYISTTPLTSGSDSVLIHVLPTHAQIPKKADSKFGILQSTQITVHEKISGAAARAPAGTYTATITIKLTFG